ncbi:hypothetical protein ACGC1H_002071 [Rhizoctonia solani]|uniref:F-box domain-containing protein n=1 Tax=Rhizoctonia solani TaxID=456999 RepID=A0A8H2WR20_9AGAM|nr:unnamed protein product [Rhizoctonia solani]
MFEVSLPFYPAIRQWEEAGILLHKTLTDYLELSASVEKNSLASGVPPAYLATRIDSALGSLHITLGQQLSQARATLSQTRNQILSHFYRLPEEVLSDIFMCVVFAPMDLSHRDPMSMKRFVLDTYHSLYNLLGVCTTWRKAALDRGSLWSIVPLFSESVSSVDLNSALKLVLGRGKRMGLSLAADLPVPAGEVTASIVARNASRFHTAALVTPSTSIVRSLLGILMDHNGADSLTLSRLSIYQEREIAGIFPEAEDYVFQSSSERASFHRLVRQLSMIQMRNVHIKWDTLTFSDQLTTLCLQEVNLGYDSGINSLLNALSSATQLRELKLVKIRTYQGSSLPQNPEALSDIWFPNLQLLLIQDVYFNTLSWFLLCIRSRTHRFSFVFTRKALRRNFPGGEEPEDNDVDIVCELLENIPVHALLIDVESLDADMNVLAPWELKRLMKVIPTLETLWMNMWELADPYCRALHSPRKSNNSTSPSLVNLYLSCVTSLEPEAFKEIINSYCGSIRRVGLGGASALITKDVVDWDTPIAEEELATWLKENVQEFIKIDRNFAPPDFCQISWQMW